MKKYWGIIGAILVAVALTGCGNNSQSKASDSKNVTTHKVVKTSHKKKKSSPVTTKSTTEAESDSSQKEENTENQDLDSQNTDSQNQDSQSQNSQNSELHNAEDFKKFMLDNDLLPNPRGLPVIAYNGGIQFNEYEVYSDADYNDAVENEGEVSPEKTVRAKYTVALDLGVRKEAYFLGDDNNVYFNMYDSKKAVELAPEVNSAYHAYYGE